MKQYLKYLLQLVLSPRNGWEDIEKSGLTSRRIAAQGYYPLIACAAVSEYAQALFHHHVVFLKLFISMVVTFVVFFISYVFGTFVLSFAVDTSSSQVRIDEEERCRVFTLFTLGLLAIIWIIVNFLPVTRLVLFFLPCYVALVQWKGCEYMHVEPKRTGHFMSAAILGVLVPPYIFYYVFSLIF